KELSRCILPILRKSNCTNPVVFAGLSCSTSGKEAERAQGLPKKEGQLLNNYTIDKNIQKREVLLHFFVWLLLPVHPSIKNLIFKHSIGFPQILIGFM